MTIETAPEPIIVGNTELRRLGRVTKSDSADIYAKCEFKNPTGSHKDRVYGYMLTELEKSGEIRPGMTLIDCSTGNGGAALAQVGRARGYKVVILMPAGMTAERKIQIRSFGAELLETPADGFLLFAEETARRLVAQRPNSYFLDQSTSPLNWQAWRSCGREIVDEFRRMNTQVDYFVCSVGTGGTFSGIADVLKAEFPAVVTVAVEVDKSAALHAKRDGKAFIHQPHNLMGLGPGKVPRNLCEELVDRLELVSGDESWQMMKELIGTENLFVGPTAGGNVVVSRRCASQAGSGKNVVTVLFDSAWKYFSVWDGQYGSY
jgi:cysteine synthase A